MLRYLDLFLRQLGAKVMVPSNAFKGLELIKHSLPDLVLFDMLGRPIIAFGGRVEEASRAGLFSGFSPGPVPKINERHDNIFLRPESARSG